MLCAADIIYLKAAKQYLAEDVGENDSIRSVLRAECAS